MPASLERTDTPNRETADSRASHHTTVSFVDLLQGHGGEFTAAFSVPSGGGCCLMTVEGLGEPQGPISVHVDGRDALFQTIRCEGHWICMGVLPASSQWWTAVKLEFKMTAVADERCSARVSTHRARALSSMVDRSFLPAKAADARLPDQNPRHQSSIIGSIEAALASGETEEAVKLTVTALALGLDEVKNSHGIRVLKAAAANADFTVSNDGLKLFIAMSS